MNLYNGNTAQMYMVPASNMMSNGTLTWGKFSSRHFGILE